VDNGFFPPFQMITQKIRLRLVDWISYRISRSSPNPIKHQISEKWDRSNPLISVIIPCFNHGIYLAEAVDSVLGQTWGDLEIIVVNDGSTESDTVAIMGSFKRPKTSLVHHPENRGLPAARNTGIEQARGKYICCLDADDKLHPTYLEKALLAMEANQGIDFVYSWTQVFGDEDRVWYAPQFDPSVLIDYNQLNPPGVFRREAWRTVGGFREEMREGYEDWEFWIRLARKGFRGYRIPEKLIYVRRVGRSFIHRAMERQQELIEDIKRYNPDVYQDLSWLKNIQRAYHEVYVPKPFVNLNRAEDYMSIQHPKLWINHQKASKVKDILPEIIAQLSQHSGNSIFVSFRILDEDIVDALMAQTPYVYILPHFLPRYTWFRFIYQLLISTRGINRAQIKII